MSLKSSTRLAVNAWLFKSIFELSLKSFIQLLAKEYRNKLFLYLFFDRMFLMNNVQLIPATALISRIIRPMLFFPIGTLLNQMSPFGLCFGVR